MNRHLFTTSFVSQICALFIIFAPQDLVAAADTKSGEDAKSQAMASVAAYEIVQSAIAERIRAEFNKDVLDHSFKTALLSSASSEDKLELQRLLSRYKKNPAVSYEVIGSNFQMSDRNGKIIFEISPPLLGQSSFVLNGRKWKRPESGSILRDLNRHLKSNSAEDKPSSAQRFFDSLIAKAAVASGANAELLPLYYFVETANETNAKHIWEVISKSGTIDALRHGAFFKDVGMYDSVIAAFKRYTLAPYSVQCTKEGAEGLAQISGTNVRFIARPDSAVQIKSDGSDQWLIFEPAIRNTAKIVLDIDKTMDAVLNADSAAPMKEKLQAALRSHKAVNRLCRFAAHLDAAEFKFPACAYFPPELAPAQMNLSRYSEWYREYESEISELAEKISSVTVVRDAYSHISACQTLGCGTIYVDNSESQFRIPPNKTESAVSAALQFTPKSSPNAAGDSKQAVIEYACATKNGACQSVKIRDRNSLSGDDLNKAISLVSKANEALRWNGKDPSVVKPIAAIRLLGPCCSDSVCRTLAFQKGVNLIPNDPKSKGTAK